jgi:RNA polymerase sigma-70 factor (ECF subfamily)
VGIYEHNVDTVYRVCFAYMKNAADAEDAVQEVFVRLIKAGAHFENTDHEKAWLIRAASNQCKNALRNSKRRREFPFDGERPQNGTGVETDGVFAAVMSLPEKCKATVYLYYYEGYNSVEISKILKMPESTGRSRLLKARAELRGMLGGDFDEK